MKAKKPLDVLGWLGSSGYRMVIDEPTRRAVEAAKDRSSSTTKHENRPIKIDGSDESGDKKV